MKTSILALLLFFSTSFSQFKLVSIYPNVNFLQPLDYEEPDDGTNRVFIVTQEGVIYVVPKNDSSVSVKKVFLDIKDRITSGGETGLLGLVFHPDYKNNGYFYLNYTAPSPLRTRIVRYSIDKSDPDKADKNSELILLEVNQPFVNHNAGQLRFGPDGYLYFGLGDGGSGGDPNNNAQNRSVLLGKMLRIDVNKTEGGNNYAIPPDNPYANNAQGFRPEIFAYGFRNPWRFNFDPVTNNVWIGDVGQDLWEEIDILEKGKNYGWRLMEGFHCYNPSSGCDTAGLTLPVWEYGHNDSGGNSITGGYVYRGKNFPELTGKYIYADFVSGRIWALTFNGSKAVRNELLIDTDKGISSFGTDKDNDLYICAFDGNIYKFAYDKPTSVPGGKPASYGLLYNFPNPFNPSTTIIADIKENAHIKIDIFNLTGEQLKTLVNQDLSAGRYKYLWDAEGFPSGVYIYRLTSSNLNGKQVNYQSARKMVLLK